MANINTKAAMQMPQNTPSADGTEKQGSAQAQAPAQQPLPPVSGASETPHGAAAPAAVDISEESVAGEEDPGAALDLLWPPPSPPPPTA
jgi:hypothetical protein